MKKYTIIWSREEDGKKLACRGLPARVLLQRIQNVVNENGRVTIHGIHEDDAS